MYPFYQVTSMAERALEERESGAATGWRPVPDPTLLTTEALHREIASLRELEETRLEGLESKLETRLDGMDRAVDLIHGAADRIPSETDIKVASVKELVMAEIEAARDGFAAEVKTINEKFDGIATQFHERDERVKESATARDTAVAAALQAQKESAGAQTESLTLSIGKSEKSTSEQITQLATLQQQNTAAVNDKVNALAERMTRFEGLGLGAQTAENTARLNSTLGLQGLGVHTQQNSLTLAIAGLAFTLLIGSAGIVIALLAHHP
jgi:hypothetical protein